MINVGTRRASTPFLLCAPAFVCGFLRQCPAMPSCGDCLSPNLWLHFTSSIIKSGVNTKINRSQHFHTQLSPRCPEAHLIWHLRAQLDDGQCERSARRDPKPAQARRTLLASEQHPSCVRLSVWVTFLLSNYEPIKMHRKSTEQLP